ncbi:hypothetical protein Goarm_012705 [Gossypium armourianum]|uniref:Uncharacterized protein n=1 Tax=Gossypium armourianum TaxID=34283 RepID=A0A7J9J0L9_9ROSI|nr:hypothetical protein [Gossypium armourianum]
MFYLFMYNLVLAIVVYI